MTTFLAARPRSYRASAPFVLAALLAGTHAHAQDATGGVDAIFSAFDPAEPGCAAAVARDGRVVVNRAFGLAHLEHAVPNTPATIFDVASVNKQFTAAAVLMLAEEGRLSLQDDIRRYLPEMPDYGTPITIDHVLTQTSGLRDWLFLSMIAGHHPFKSPRMYQAADVLDLAARQRGLNHAPGAEFSYTNTGYHLLTIIVERVSGRSLQDFTSERIFQPLGMTSTRWRADIREVIPGRATSYEREDGRWMHGMPLFDNLFTTTGDLLRWNDALAENRLGPRITQELQRQGRLNDGSPIEFAPGMAYTRGLTIGEHRGAQEIAHGGSSAGYRSYVSRYPAHRLSVAVLCNSGEANATRIARDLASLFLPEPRRGTAPAAAAAAAAPPAPAPATQREAWAPAAAELAAFAGRYGSEEAGSTVRITVEGNRLRLNIDGRPGMGQVLRPLQRDEFAGTANTRVRFSRDAAGRVVSYGISLPRARDVRFTRLGDATDPPLPQAPAAAGPAVDPGPETASAAPGALVGFYQAAPGHGITITLEGGTLYGEPKGQPKAQLVPMSGTSYSVGREGAAMTATFTLGVDGRATALVLRREDGTERTFPRAP